MKIKLKVPEDVARWNDWTDGELLFLSFFYYVYGFKRNKLNCAYHMWSADVSAILNTHDSSAIDVWDERLVRLRRLFTIGIVNNHCLRIKWITGTGRFENRLCKHEVWITDPHIINRYWYLAGRCSDSDIIDHTTTEPYERYVNGRPRTPATIQPIHWKQRNLYKYE